MAPLDFRTIEWDLIALKVVIILTKVGNLQALMAFHIYTQTEPKT